jgi:hypothetical protein
MNPQGGLQSMAIAEVVSTATPPHSFFPQLSLALGISVIGFGLVIRYRERIVPLLGTRPRRMFWEVGVIGSLAALMAIMVEAVDWKSVLLGTKTFLDTVLLWVMAVDLGGIVTAQSLAVAHADFVESKKRDAEEKWARERAKWERNRVSFEAELDSVREQRDFAGIVNEAFLRVVSRKRERLRTTGSNARFVELKPEIQYQALVSACWEIVEKLVNESRQREAKHRVRVTYFRIVGRRLVVSHCWDGTAGDCFSRLIETDPSVRARFDLDSGETCLALAASKTGTMYWVKDAASDAKKSTRPFVYFDEQTERDELKSIVALPIKVSGDGAPYDVITIDTDREEYFDGGASQADQLGIVIRNLAHRLLLEKAVEDAIREKSNA